MILLELLQYILLRRVPPNVNCLLLLFKSYYNLRNYSLNWIITSSFVIFQIYFSVRLGLKLTVSWISLGLLMRLLRCVQPSFLHSPCFNFSHRFDFNVADAAHSTIAIVGHDELMMTKGRRGREVEILTASWRRIRRQSGETSVRAWIGVSEQPVQSTHRPHIRVRNVIRARWPIHYPCTTRCNLDCQISSRVSERVSEWMNESCKSATCASITWRNRRSCRDSRNAWKFSLE